MTDEPLDIAAARRGRLSIRAKGLLVIAALIVYATSIATYAFYQKAQVRGRFDEIQRSLETDAELKDADVAIFYAMMSLIAHGGNSDEGDSTTPIHASYMALRKQHAQLVWHEPQFGNALIACDVAYDAFAKAPMPANGNRLLSELGRVEQRYLQYGEQLARERRQKAQELRTRADSSAMTTLWFGILGLVLTGIVTGRFFKRLTMDLRALRTRALEIVRGERPEPLEVTRHDEVGQLMAAVNGMAGALDARDSELMLERQKYFHQEKMAALGTMAAGVAHEIGNPIAAIAGIAQEMSECRKQCHTDGGAGCEGCRPDLIHAQAQRLSGIAHEISDVAAPQVSDTQLLDLNEQLRSTVKLVRYDKRLRQVELRQDLDPQLPAIQGIPDQLTQLIMNLLINAMDALEDAADRRRVIQVATRAGHDCVYVTVEDNGHGMDRDVRSHAFDAFFTTKTAGKGTGLGLALCYSIMQNHGGSIELESVPAIGTLVRLTFPVEPATAT